MRKFLMMITMMLVIGVTAIAQTSTTTVIHGAVVDKNGNPLPGAVVSATGGAETALVEADGTFTMEIPIWLKSVTASYPGYGSKKKKPVFDKDMVFTLGRKEPMKAFLNIVGAVPIADGEVTGGVGIMAGALDDWGFYGKVVFPLWHNTINVGENRVKSLQVTIGGIRHIYKSFYLSLGIGYGGTVHDMWNYDHHQSEVVSDPGMAFEIGAIFRIGKHFDLSIGYTQTLGFEYLYVNEIPYLSFGYVF